MTDPAEAAEEPTLHEPRGRVDGEPRGEAAERHDVRDASRPDVEDDGREHHEHRDQERSRQHVVLNVSWRFRRRL